MKVVIISQKMFIARRFEWRRMRFVWYRVMRGGTDWQPMSYTKRAVPFNLEKAAKSLQSKAIDK